MKVLVITPTMGRSRFLRDTVESVSRLPNELRHILACPRAVRDRLRGDFPQLTVIEEEASGIYAAISTAVRNAGEWDFCTWINDDDLLRADFAKTVAAAKAGEADVIYSDVAYVDANGRNLGRIPTGQPRSVAAVLARGCAPFTQQGTLIARELWERLQGFDVHWRLAADFDFWCRAAVAGASFHRVAATVASFRLHPNQLSADQESVRREIAAICARHRSALRSRSQPGSWLLFRLASAIRITERRWRAGVWTSRALYARYSIPS